MLGIAVHHALAAWHLLPLDERIDDALRPLLRQAWRTVDRTEVFASREEEASWGQRGLSMLEAYARTFDRRVVPVAVELPLSIRVGKTLLRGRADRVDRSRAFSGLEVVDYKTGRVQMDPREDLAAGYYALAIRETFGEPVPQVRFLGLTDQVERSWMVEMEDLARAREQLTTRVDQIGADRVWAAAPGRQCAWCEFADICAARLAERTDGGVRCHGQATSVGRPPNASVHTFG